MVREEAFKVIYAQFFPKGADTNQYAHYVFNTFDPDHTGAITFTVSLYLFVMDLIKGEFVTRMVRTS